MANLRILIHNLGHYDLYLVVRCDDGTEFIARPKAHYMRKVSEHIVDEMIGMTRRTDSRVDLHLQSPYRLEAKNTRRQVLDLNETQARQLAHSEGEIVGLEFRNFTSVIHKWLEAAHAHDALHVLFASSDSNDKELRGSSTYLVARLLNQFVETNFPTVAAQTLPPLQDDPYRFSGMASYIRTSVRPNVDQLISNHVGDGRADWIRGIQLAISASTGTTPMISSLHEAFRDLAPSFLHVPKARMRPADNTLHEAEHYAFGAITQHVAIPVKELTKLEQQLVRKMKKWRDDYERVVQGPENELSKFWLRKGKKPVLAVLCVKQGPSYTFYSACNLEVSMPTGSLCAERNAIGSALAANPALRREEIKLVAVLSLPELGTDGKKANNPLGPCGACMEWLRKVADVTPDVRILTFEDTDCRHVFVDHVV